MIRLCRFFKWTRQGFYKDEKRSEEMILGETIVIELVLAQRRRHKRMGAKKLYSLLQSDLSKLSVGIGRDKFFDLLRTNDLLVKRRRKYAVTTQSYHWFRVYENLLTDFVPQNVHEVWVCDITYIRVEKGFVYLFLITDAYSRKIVGWELSDSLAVGGALSALKMALKQCKDPDRLIHHSDRGFQYCCYDYVGILKSNGIRISMAEAGNCYQNAMAERVNGILKDEYGLDETFKEYGEARMAVKEAIGNYNEYRPHWSLGLKTPASVHVEAG